MNIILLEKINKLGDIGDEVTVKSGYARNFLVPNGKALYCTPENREYFKQKKDLIKAEDEKSKKEAEKIAGKLIGKEVVLIRAASDAGQLFGSVSTKDIVKYLNDDDIQILKNQVSLNKSIKNLTFEKINIILHPEVLCEITLNVARSTEEAEIQKEQGKAITTAENSELNDSSINEINEDVNNVSFENNKEETENSVAEQIINENPKATDETTTDKKNKDL